MFFNWKGAAIVLAVLAAVIGLCVVDPAEDKLLADIALYLGLSKTVYENFKAGKKPSHDKGALKAAGVPPSLVALAR